MKNFLKNHWALIVVIVILIVVTILSLRIGEHLLSNDNYSPELDPMLTIERSFLTPAWRAYRVLGFGSESEQADIFRTGLMGILSTILPGWSLAQAFSLIALWTGVLSMGFLAKAFVKEFFAKKLINIVFLTSSLIYLTTLWTAWVFNFNMMPYIAQYGFLPLLLLSLYMVRKFNYKRLFFVFISSILFTGTCVISTLFFVDIVLIILFVVYIMILKKYDWKDLLRGFLVFFVTQLFWLLPFLFSSLSNTQGYVDSYTNRSITVNTIDLEKQQLTADNAARFYTRLVGTVDDPANSTYIFSETENYQLYDFYKVFGLVPLFLSLLGLIFVVVKRKWKLIPLWIVMFGCLFLLKNQNPPLGELYMWLQNNFEIFKQVFRWISSKMAEPYLILVTITAAIGMISLLKFLGSFFGKKLKVVFIILATSFFTFSALFYSEYLFNNQLFATRATVSYPAEYKELAKYLGNDKTSRIFYAPPANNGYFREYSWGFVGSQFIGYVLPNPVMDMSLSIGSKEGELAMLELANTFNSNQKGEFLDDLAKYDVKYVLVDRSLIKGRYGYEIDWDVVDNLTLGMDLVWSDDFLELYQIDDDSNTEYAEVLGSSDLINNGTFVRESSIKPTIDIFNLDLSDSILKNGGIEKEITYTGNTTSLLVNLSDIDQKKLPSTIYVENGNINIQPTLPQITGLNVNSRKTFSPAISKNFSAFVFNNTVFESKDIKVGTTTDVLWGDINTVYGIDRNSFSIEDYTIKMYKSKVGDCVGDTFKESSKTKVERLDEGFSMSGTSESICAQYPISLEYGQRYVASIHLEWEAEENSSFGYCLFSNSTQKCLNDDKYIYSQNGSGNQDILIPRVLNGEDSFSLTIYLQNPKKGSKKVVVKDVSLSFSTSFSSFEKSYEYEDSVDRQVKYENGDTIKINIPVIQNSDSSYAYTYPRSLSTLWSTNASSSQSNTYEVLSDLQGMTQLVYGQYMNQYNHLLSTNPSSKYLWFWEGTNISNIPANLCLTYIGDDKCWVDDNLYPDIRSSVTKIVLPSSKGDQRLDGSFNSISFATDSKNVLNNFVVMEIPSQWLKLKLSPTSITEYDEIEAQPINGNVYGVGYMYDGNLKSSNVLLTIPQSKSDGWVAIKFVDGSPSLLSDDSRVYVNGWKQGWDVSDVDFDSIVVLYWPNILGYVGYFGILILLTALLLNMSKEIIHDARRK